MEKNIIENLLRSSKKSDIKKAVSLLSKNNIEGHSERLFTLLQEYINDPKSWEICCQIIDYLGLNQYNYCINFLGDITQKNLSHDMITMSASRALCRIKKQDSQDISEVIKLLSFGKFAVVNGALRFLGEDKIIPDNRDIEAIISLINEFEPKLEKGYSDVRMGLALASAGWEKSKEVNCFLNSCLNSNYVPLMKIAKNSLQGKYSKL